MTDLIITVDDYTFDQIIKKHRFIVIDFWAPWCAPCWMVAPIIEELAKDYVGKVTFGKLNVDENPITTSEFSILSIPTLLLFKDGREVGRIVGAAPRQRIEAEMRKRFNANYPFR